MRYLLITILLLTGCTRKLNSVDTYYNAHTDCKILWPQPGVSLTLCKIINKSGDSLCMANPNNGGAVIPCSFYEGL